MLYIFYDLASENIYIRNDHSSVFTFQTSLWAPDSPISLFQDVLQVSQNMSTLISWPSFQTHLNYYLLRASLFSPFEHNSLPLYLMPTLPVGFHLHVTPFNRPYLTLSNRLFINTLYFSSEPIGQDHLQLYIYLWAFCSLLTSLTLTRLEAPYQLPHLFKSAKSLSSDWGLSWSYLEFQSYTPIFLPLL